MTPQVFQILLTISEGPRHGYAIITDIRDRTEGQMDLTPSTLYDALARLSDQGLIAEAAAPPDAPTAESRRRYYTLTRSGRDAAQEETARLTRLVYMARAKNFHV
ncbi:MAG: helix-turn-helix transcriptional regulator [Acidimicrobiia bacterium]|nr:helix-turn-helix transcriptional regulator [Acidimicrobiia bacterium]